MCFVFAERRVLVIIVRITMNVLIEKRTEVKQTLSMVTERSLIMETIFISKENGQADDLILIIRSKVITGKNITT